jgi:hypothetical protein
VDPLANVPVAVKACACPTSRFTCEGVTAMCCSVQSTTSIAWPVAPVVTSVATSAVVPGSRDAK